MSDLRIAAVQFEHRDGDQAYNLGRIHELATQAVERGADVVSFHECSISAYSFVQPFSKEQLLELAEPVPDGPSVDALMRISADVGLPILAGLFERDGDDVFNTYIAVDGDRLVGKHRKLHAFVSPHLSSGSEIATFELCGWSCSILICYDNNLPENVRIAALKGAEIVFMPHVTGCLPSVMPVGESSILHFGSVATQTRSPCDKSSIVPKVADGSCVGCRRALGRTESMPSSPTDRHGRWSGSQR